MPVPTDITAGTLTITNGSTAVTGVGTSWLASDLRQGDVILWIEGGDGFQTPILADVPASNTALTLVEPWEGPTLSGVRYRIRFQWDSSRVSAQSRQLIEMLDNGNVLALSGITGPGVPVFDGPHSMVIRPETDFINGVAYDVQVDTLADRATYDGQTQGFAVLVSDVGGGRSAVYSKASNTSGDWTDPAYVTGPAGITPRGDYSGATTYAINDVVVFNGSSFRKITTAAAGNAPSSATPPIDNANWQVFVARGDVGIVPRGAYSAGTVYAINDWVTFNGSSFRKLTTAGAGTSPSAATPPVDNANWQVVASVGATGSISGVTTFWQGRITVDATAAPATDGVTSGTRLGTTLAAVNSAPSGYLQSGNGFSRVDAGATGAPAGLVGTGHPLISLWTSVGSFGSNILLDRTRNRLMIQSINSSVASSWAELWDSVSLPTITQAQAEAGVLTSAFAWSPERVRQAIVALAPAGGNGRTPLSGTANAIILTSAVPLSTGLAVRFRATSANTGAATIAYGGGAAVACRTITGVALPAGYIRTDVDTIATYDGTFWVLGREIEGGSNANGEYTRFPDGAQICWNTSSIASSATTTVDWVYPVTFSSATSMSLGALPASATTTAAFVVQLAARSATAITFNILNAASGGRVVQGAYFTVMGRWY